MLARLSLRRQSARRSARGVGSEYSEAVEPPDPDQVKSLADLIAFLDGLSEHFAREHEGDDWQNWNVGDYLESVAAWLKDGPPQLMKDEWREEIDRDRPTWRGVAMLFEAGRIYE
jgi:hypothetical protein